MIIFQTNKIWIFVFDSFAELDKSAIISSLKLCMCLTDEKNEYLLDLVSMIQIDMS